MSAWNPLDGWISSKPTLVEVLSTIGPITIDDFSIINDAVRSFIALIDCQSLVSLSPYLALSIVGDKGLAIDI